MRLIYKILLIIIAFLLLMIILGTAGWALSRRRDAGTAGGAALSAGSETAFNEQNFYGIGRLRVPLLGALSGTPREAAPDTPAPTAVISVVFPYNAADIAFTEELARNITFFRETITRRFEKMAADDPLLRDETALKEEFLEKFNSRLLLGKINKLFFSEFVILE